MRNAFQKRRRHRDLAVLGLMALAGTLAGAVPACRACRQALADGLIVRT
ncbi:MAG: hypothetical protein VW268_00060 [Rhodospirillaceae bacterium]